MQPHREATQMARLIREASAGNGTSWIREVPHEKLVAAINLVVAGYQIALSRVLGNGFTGLNQLLIRELGEYVRALAGDAGCGGSGPERIRRALAGSGIARDVSVEPIVESGSIVGYRVTVRGSLFSPLYRILLQRGMKQFPLSPEAMLVAAVTAASTGDSVRVNVDTTILDEDTLVIEVRRIHRIYRGRTAGR